MIQYRKYSEECIAIEKRLWKDAEKTIPFNLEGYEIQIHIIRVSTGLVARNSQGLPMIYKDEDITKVANEFALIIPREDSILLESDVQLQLSLKQNNCVLKTVLEDIEIYKSKNWEE